MTKTITPPADEPGTPEPVDSETPKILKKILTRLDILESSDLATEEVDVPEWGGTVIIRALTGVERDAYESEIFQMRGTGKGIEYNLSNIRAKLSARSIVDEAGGRLFTDADIVRLGTKSAAALDKVFAVAQRLSRLTNQDVKELVDQMGNAQSASSGSA